MNKPFVSQCRWMNSTVALILLGTVLYCPSAIRAADNADTIDIGSRRELFVDDHLIQQMSGAELKLHQPIAQELVLTCDAPWEGNTSAYFTIFRDDNLFRAFYRGSHFDEAIRKGSNGQKVCYAESRDGIHWTKPSLGIVEFDGSKHNNILWNGDGSHNFAPFKDGNPDCPADARFKALAGQKITLPGKEKPRDCLTAFKSPDGIHWSVMGKAVITDGAFDSQNLAFWDAERGEYRAYWRYFSKGYTDERGWKPGGHRSIRTATSKDFVHWEHQADLKYVDSPAEHLYTNAVQPYFRAPHLYVAFPTRYQPKTQQVEPVLMTSRDGVLFRRWKEELIAITAPKDRDGNRSNYMTYGLLQLPGNDREISVYATEAYYAGPGSRVRRFTFRTDGFVSLHAKLKATVMTKPLIFRGKELELNYVTSDGGFVRVELQDEKGKSIPGFTLDACTLPSGDHLDRSVSWNSKTDVSALAGKPVRLRVELQHADLYSLRFH